MNIYNDLNLSFIPHPNSGDVIQSSDLEAVRSSLITIINLAPFELPFDNIGGGNIKQMLFEQLSPSSIAVIKNQMTNTITRLEPRVIINDLYVGMVQNSNTQINIGILYTVIGNPVQQNISLTMNKAR